MDYSKTTLGVIVGNRDFFPDHLISEGRQDILEVLAEMGIEAVILDEDATKLGAVETWDNAKLCADLFKRNADRINGILVVLPNFGDEKGIADTIQLSGLNVPVLIQAYPDELDKLFVERRRDCVLRQNLGLQQPLSVRHTLHADQTPHRVAQR